MGVRVAFDVGTVRIGVATSDPGGLLASPQPAIPAGGDSIGLALQIVSEYSVSEIIIGLPRTLKGTESASTELARSWACRIEDQALVPVILVDERFTTIAAQRSLSEAGLNVKKSRSRIDSAAAAVLLQGYLDAQSGK